MPIDVKVTGTGHVSGHAVLEQSLHKPPGKMAGAVVYAERILTFGPTLVPFLNDNFGIAMNQDASFGGTPDMIHNGIDSTLWTASNITGAKVTFNVDDTRAHGGIITVVDYTALSGITATIGVDGSDTVKTEGGTWTAATSNNATATSLASDLDSITGVSASATAAVVTITADINVNISKVDTSDGTNLPGTGQAVEADNMAVNDVFQFNKGGDLTIANYTAITGWINIDKDWAGDTVELYCYDTGGAVDVGSRIMLEDYIVSASFDVWQSFVIPFTDFQFSELTFDAIRVELAVKDGGKSPKYYLDDVQVEQTGTPLVYKVGVAPGQVFHIDEIRVRVEDAFDSTLANATVPNLPIDAILGVAELTNGIVFRRIQKGVTLFSSTFKTLGDFLSTGSELSGVAGNATNTGFTMTVTFDPPIVLDGGILNNFLSYTVSDNLTGLTRLTAVARGALET